MKVLRVVCLVVLSSCVLWGCGDPSDNNGTGPGNNGQNTGNNGGGDGVCPGSTCLVYSTSNNNTDPATGAVWFVDAQNPDASRVELTSELGEHGYISASALSPNGQFFAFVTGSPNNALYWVNLAGDQSPILLQDGEVQERGTQLIFSPDSKYLFVRGEYDRGTKLSVVETASPDEPVLVNDPLSGEDAYPESEVSRVDISPDSARVWYWANDASQDRFTEEVGLYRAELGGGSIEPNQVLSLNDLSYSYGARRVGPEGNQLVIEAEEGAARGIYHYDLEQGLSSERNLLDLSGEPESTNVVSASFSPDGQYLSVHLQRRQEGDPTGEYDHHMVIIPLDAPDDLVETDVLFTGLIGSSEWAPDSTAIAYVTHSTDAEQSELLAIGTDGLVDTLLDLQATDWLMRDDGTIFVYGSESDPSGIGLFRTSFPEGETPVKMAGDGAVSSAYRPKRNADGSTLFFQMDTKAERSWELYAVPSDEPGAEPTLISQPFEESGEFVNLFYVIGGTD